MKENSDYYTIKLNPLKEDISKQRKEKEKGKENKINPKKKIEQNIIKEPIGIYPLKSINVYKGEIRNTTAPNKARPSILKKNLKHLKIVAKNKDVKELVYSKIFNNKIYNYNDIIMSKKMLGQSLPKNISKKNHLYNFNQDIEYQNSSNNDIRNFISPFNNRDNNNGNMIQREMENYTNKDKNNGYNKNINNGNIFNPIIENAKVIDDYKNNKKIKKNMQMDYVYLNKINKNNFIDIKILNNKFMNMNNNKIFRNNNSFNNANFQNKINHNVYGVEEMGKNKRNTKLFNNFKNIIISNSLVIKKEKRSMSSSITIPRNQLKQINSQVIMNGFGMYIENDLMKSANNTMTHKTKISNKIKKPETNKKNNIYQYIILKGNASYLIKNCMKHRINWVEADNNLDNNNNMFNFKWKELSFGIDYNNLNRNPGMKQIVNHYENHYVLSNKANMFINMMKYCEQRKLSIFKYVPFTIVFKIKDRRKIKNNEKQKRWMEKLEKLKNFIHNINTNIKEFNEIGNFYYNEDFIKDKEKRNEFERLEFIKMLKRKKEKEIEESKLKEFKDNDKMKEYFFKKQKSLKDIDDYKEEKYNGKFQVYSDIFPRLKITDKLPTRYMNSEDKEKDKKTDIRIGNNTLIEIPKTHFQGKNMWVLKAVNLNRGMCIKVVNSFEQMEKVINKFKKGVDYRFTAEKIEEEEEQKENERLSKHQNQKEDMNLSDCESKLSKKISPIKIEEFEEKSDKKNEKNKTEENISSMNKFDKIVNNDKNNNININNKNNNNEEKEEKIYNCNKILIQKYIENPLLYKGRKCDMRIWVLLTHQMKVFLFKEGHLKTCSVEFDLNSHDAFTHITNYSFQKKNLNFQKFEKGNEVPFYEFQKFIDENYPQKNYKLKRDLMKQIKEIISISMRSGKNKINKNGRSHQFEIFGYDFMLDADFNVFLIEINTNPGLEISSPWIQVLVPRMLDDALRLTVDKVFEPVYDFSKSHKEKYTEEQKILFEKNKNKIEIDFNSVNNIKNNEYKNKNNLNNILNISRDISIMSSDNGGTNKSNNKKNDININSDVPSTTTFGSNKNNNIFNINLDLDDFDQKYINNQENKNDININLNKTNKNFIKKEQIKNIIEINNSNKQQDKDITIQKNNAKKFTDKEKSKEKLIYKNINEKKYNGKYISPFPVPGYSNDENLWCFVCDLNSKDPLDIKIEKEKEKEKQKLNDKNSFTGIRHLLKKKDKKNKDKKRGKKGNNGKNNKKINKK